MLQKKIALLIHLLLQKMVAKFKQALWRLLLQTCSDTATLLTIKSPLHLQSNRTKMLFLRSAHVAHCSVWENLCALRKILFDWNNERTHLGVRHVAIFRLAVFGIRGVVSTRAAVSFILWLLIAGIVRIATSVRVHWNVSALLTRSDARFLYFRTMSQPKLLLQYDRQVNIMIFPATTQCDNTAMQAIHPLCKI